MHPVACDQRTRARVAFALRLRGVLPRGDAHQTTLELLEPAAVSTGTVRKNGWPHSRRTVCSVCRARFKSDARYFWRISAASRSA